MDKIFMNSKYSKTSDPQHLIPDFNLLSCELDSFTFNVLYCVILY